MGRSYDVAVIGGGPAGMMAAGTSASNGAEVILLEKNPYLGKKLLITGKGRCNITNDERDIKIFADRFGKNGKFLYSVLAKFGVYETLNFFNSRGLETKTERGNRVFPVSDDAVDVLQTLKIYLKETGVIIKEGIKVISLECDKSNIKKIITDNGIITARNYVLCTGGKAYPGTGSSGDGLTWAENLGHTLIKPEPALTELNIKEKWIKNLKGLSLKNVTIAIYMDSKKIDERFGEATFTGTGMGGPIILDMSKRISTLAGNDLRMSIDLKPALDFKKLDERILKDLNKNRNRKFKSSLNKLLPAKLIPVVVGLSGIDPDKKANSVSKEERRKFLHILKGLKLSIRNVCGFNRAIITSGGIPLDEVYSKTMRSKIINNLFFAGEIIDLDGPTGGYNLQVCWSTGYIAGSSASEKRDIKTR